MGEKALRAIGCLVMVVAIGLTILFVGFKIAGVGRVAEWSWLWVLSPAWIYMLWVAFWVVAGIVGYAVSTWRDRTPDPYRTFEPLRRFRAWRWKKFEQKYNPETEN